MKVSQVGKCESGKRHAHFPLSPFFLFLQRSAVHIERVTSLDRPDLAPYATLRQHEEHRQQGIFVAEEIAGLNPVVIPDVNIPKVTYCDPEVASVGLSEARAVEQYGADNVSSYDYSLAGNGKSEIIGTSGSVKVVRVNDGPVVGVHMIGARVGELIGEAQLAVNWEAYPEDIAPLVHAHPTQSEALGEAFMYLAGKPLHTL